jgi:hypothetical protein
MAFNDRCREVFPTWMALPSTRRIPVQVLLSLNATARRLVIVTTRTVPGVGSAASAALNNPCTTRFHSLDGNRYSRVRAALCALGRAATTGHTWGPSAAIERELRRGAAPQAVPPRQRSHVDVPSRTRQSAGAVSLSPLPETAPAAAESRRSSRAVGTLVEVWHCQGTSSPARSSTLSPERP